LGNILLLIEAKEKMELASSQPGNNCQEPIICQLFHNKLEN